jgi:protein-S-isoprenylcysteine O-methyltransferase Ste14
LKRAGDLLFPRRGLLLALLFALLLAARAFSDAPLHPEALILLAAAAALRLWAGRDIGPHSHGNRIEGPALATTGAYAFGRNPLYLSNMLAAAGLVLFAGCLTPGSSAALIAAAALHHALLVRAEEDFLAARHGESWRVYRDVTPRWLGLPRGGAAAAAHPAAARGTWGEAFRRQALHAVKPAFAAAILWALSLV